MAASRNDNPVGKLSTIAGGQAGSLRARATEFAERIYRTRLKCRFVATTETARIPEDITGRARRVPVGEVNWRTTFRALRHRNYRLFFYGQLVSLIGTWLQQTAMSWFVYEITGSKFLLGAVSAIGSAPMMIFSLWGGSLADRYPKRSILIGTQAAQMFCAFVLAAGAHLGFANANFIIVIAALNGIAMGFDIPAPQFGSQVCEITSRCCKSN